MVQATTDDRCRSTGPKRPRLLQAGKSKCENVGGCVTEKGATVRRSFRSCLVVCVPDDVGSDYTLHAKLFDRLRKRIAGDASVPLYGRTSTGDLSLQNSLQHLVSGVLRSVQAGSMKLEHDQNIHGTWLTVPDAFTPRRRELLPNLPADHLSVHHLMSSADTVKVWLTNGQVVERPFCEVTTNPCIPLSIARLNSPCPPLHSNAKKRCLQLPHVCFSLSAPHTLTLIAPMRPKLSCSGVSFPRGREKLSSIVSLRC